MRVAIVHQTHKDHPICTPPCEPNVTSTSSMSMVKVERPLNLLWSCEPITKRGKVALVHSRDGVRDDPSPGSLCHGRLATDRFRASGRQHPVQDRHADRSLGLLSSETAGS